MHSVFSTPFSSRLWSLVIFGLAGMLSSIVAAEDPAADEVPELVVRIPRPENIVFSNRNVYAQSLLELALKKSGEPHHFEYVKIAIGNSARNAKFILKGRYDISWFHTDKNVESQLLPIRIPIFKGLIGWRIAFIRKGDQPVFSAVESLNELAEYKAIQGLGWPDVEIFQGNDLPIAIGLNIQNSIALLQNKRADYLPRSVVEIWDEALFFNMQDLEIEQHIALHYPSAVYFCVRPQSERLANVITKGLELSMKDGSFDKLFFHHFGDLIDQAKLSRRKVLELKNPLLTEEAPLDRKSLWFGVANQARPD